MRYIIVLFILLIAFPILLADDNIPNLQQPSYKIFTSGQPTEEGFRLLDAMGFKTVVNVLPEPECLANEKQMVTSNNMVYRTFPFDLTAFKLATIHEFAALLKTVDKPVLIHCSTGNHVGGLWFAYRALIDKVPLPEALKEGRQIGMKPELEDALFTWVTAQSQTADATRGIGK